MAKTSRFRQAVEHAPEREGEPGDAPAALPYDPDRWERRLAEARERRAVALRKRAATDRTSSVAAEDGDRAAVGGFASARSATRIPQPAAPARSDWLERVKARSAAEATAAQAARSDDRRSGGWSARRVRMVAAGFAVGIALGLVVGAVASVLMGS